MSTRNVRHGTELTWAVHQEQARIRGLNSDSGLDHLQHYFILQDKVVVEIALPQKQLLVHRLLRVQGKPVVTGVQDEIFQHQIQYSPGSESALPSSAQIRFSRLENNRSPRGVTTRTWVGAPKKLWLAVLINSYKALDWVIAAAEVEFQEFHSESVSIRSQMSTPRLTMS